MMIMSKILIVEDDKLLLKVYINVLGKNGFEVDKAEDGEKGLQKILKGGYDLVFLDIKLPQHTGIDILKQLQNKKPQQKNGPIVVLSNFDNKKIIKQAMKLGAVGYILKDKIEAKNIPNEAENYLKQADLL